MRNGDARDSVCDIGGTYLSCIAGWSLPLPATVCTSVNGFNTTRPHHQFVVDKSRLIRTKRKRGGEGGGGAHGRRRQHALLEAADALPASLGDRHTGPYLLHHQEGQAHPHDLMSWRVQYRIVSANSPMALSAYSDQHQLINTKFRTSSPSPVATAAPTLLSAYKPEPTKGLSPTRPGCLKRHPLVEVPSEGRRKEGNGLSPI